MAQKIHELNTGTYVEPSKETLASFIQQWLIEKKKNVRNSTYESYEILSKVHIIPKIGHYQLNKLNQVHINKFYDELSETLSNSTILKIHKILKMALNKAVQYGYIAKNIMGVIDAPRLNKPEMTVWNEEEVRSFLEVAKEERLYIAFLLAVTTGMRRGEILGLRWKNIDFENYSISVIQTLSNTGDRFQETKTSNGKRSIALPVEVIDQLRRHKLMIAKEKLKAGPVYQDNDLIVCTSIGTKMLPSNLRRTWNRLLEKCNVPKIRFHDLRHTHATLLLKQGVHPKIVQERLGHANIKVTLDTYSHVLPGLQEEAAKRFGESLFKTKNKNIDSL